MVCSLKFWILYFSFCSPVTIKNSAFNFFNLGLLENNYILFTWIYGFYHFLQDILEGNIKPFFSSYPKGFTLFWTQAIHVCQCNSFAEVYFLPKGNKSDLKAYHFDIDFPFLFFPRRIIPFKIFPLFLFQGLKMNYAPFIWTNGSIFKNNSYLINACRHLYFEIANSESDFFSL